MVSCVFGTGLKLSYFGLSDVGLVRDHNEDAWGAIPKKGLFLLADGMGGHQAGEVAAQKTIERLAELVKKDFSGKAEEHLRQAIKKTNAYIYQQSLKDEALSGMGTTVCCLFLNDDLAICGHVGDSRIYLFRQKQLYQLTQDHSLVNELLEMQAVNPREADIFSYKHILTKAIGTNPNVDPTVKASPVFLEDLFLLCSDGLTNLVSDEEIQKILSKSDSLEENCNSLVELAKKHGGSDNITVLLIKVELSSDIPR